MPTAGEQIREAHFVNLAQVRLLHPFVTARHDAFDVEREPADVGECELGFEKQS